MTFEDDLKYCIDRQNQAGVISIEEQCNEILEIVNEYKLDKQKVKDAIKKCSSPGRYPILLVKDLLNELGLK